MIRYDSIIYDDICYDDEIMLPIPNKDYEVFDGWYLEEEFITPVSSILTGSFGNKTFYAKFLPIEYKIDFFNFIVFAWSCSFE